MSRLDAEEVNNGLLNSNVGGSKGVDDQIYLEEVAQGHASPGLLSGETKDKLKVRREKLVNQIHMMKNVYDHKLNKFTKMFDLPPGNPLEKIVHEGEGFADGMANAMEGKGHMPKHVDLEKDFREAIHEDNVKYDAKLERREEKREAKARKERQVVASGKLPPLALDKAKGKGALNRDGLDESTAPHLYPLFPPMPPHKMAQELFGDEIITNAISHDRPTIAGIVAILQRFLRKLHAMLVENKHAKTPDEVIEKYFALVTKYLAPFEEAYRDRSIFPIREDDSIFMSLGAYRDHLLGETLRQAFKNAANPDKLFVGAVVQNCFGIDVQCRTGVEVKGKDKFGNPITQISDRPPE